MRSEWEITKELTAAKAAYHESAPTESATGLAKLVEPITALSSELVAALTEGAKPCPDCNAAPHGMRKNPATIEVGCLACAGHRARGATVGEAVAKWNEHEWVPPLKVSEPA